MRARSRFSVLWILSVIAILVGLTLAPPVAQAAKVEIELWHRWTGPQQQILQEVLKGFQAKQTEVAVKDVSVPGEYVDLMQKVLARYAAKQTPPDVLLPGYNFFNYTVRELRPTPIDEVAGAEAHAGSGSRCAAAYGNAHTNRVNISTSESPKLYSNSPAAKPRARRRRRTSWPPSFRRQLAAGLWPARVCTAPPSRPV